MEGVSFDEERQHTSVPTANPSGFTGLVMRMGLAKDAKGAVGVLLIAAVILVGIAITISLFMGSRESKLPPQEVIDGALRVR